MMQDKENVSIIIATHNNVATIERAIESVTKGVRPADLLTIADNDSTDGTYDFLCKLLGAKQVTIEDKTGWPPEFSGKFNETPVKIFRKRFTTTGHTLNVAMQMGWKNVTIFGFMDPESYYSFDKISQGIDIFHRHQSIACVVSDYDNHYSDSRVERVFLPSFDMQRLLVNFPYDNNFLVRATVFPKLKCGFNEQLQAREDYEFLLRVSEIGLIYHIPAPLHHNIIKEIDETALVGLNVPDAIQQCENQARQMALQRRNPQGG